MTQTRPRERHRGQWVAAALQRRNATARLLPPAGPPFPGRGKACAAVRRQAAGFRCLPVHSAARLETPPTAMPETDAARSRQEPRAKTEASASTAEPRPRPRRTRSAVVLALLAVPCPHLRVYRVVVSASRDATRPRRTPASPAVVSASWDARSLPREPARHEWVSAFRVEPARWESQARLAAPALRWDPALCSPVARRIPPRVRRHSGIPPSHSPPAATALWNSVRRPDPYAHHPPAARSRR